MSDELIDGSYRELKPDRNTPEPAPPEIMTRCSSPPGSAARLLDSESVARRSLSGFEVGTHVWLQELQAPGRGIAPCPEACGCDLARRPPAATPCLERCRGSGPLGTCPLTC